MEMALNFMLMSLTLSTIFLLMNVNNPFLGSIMLVMITMLLMLEVSFYISQWAAYLLMLLFLGGMMVLFLYVTSIMASFKFNMSVPTSIKLIFIILLIVGVGLVIEPIHKSSKFIDIASLFNMDSLAYITMAIVYLLMGLVVVVSVCKTGEGSLKNKIND